MRTPARRLVQGLPPVIGPGARVLILGSFPSSLSLAAGQYYANPKNQFWKIMDALVAIDPSLPYGDRLSRLISCRIALWDAIASCRRQGSADSTITGACGNPLDDLLASHPGIRLIACNGSASARSLAACPPANVTILRLPSTSPAYARMPLAGKIRAWSAICRYLDR
ncbi:MAG TPA: DNA-deoxyinosine glycosylase [Methanoregulaceae archaeon]|nr:DNA-deoxyinosine glycosylase [Methanoregulaceae archaeon]HRY74796.1 DNA-deoxyinosine glycosylase [Methanoregulaceae archaeon]